MSPNPRSPESAKDAVTAFLMFNPTCLLCDDEAKNVSMSFSFTGTEDGDQDNPDLIAAGFCDPHWADFGIICEALQLGSDAPGMEVL